MIRLVDSGDALDKHRLASAIISAEGGYLARRDVQIDLEQRLHRPEVLVDPAQAQERHLVTDRGDGGRRQIGRCQGL
jgi:hypothetical protein